MLVHSGKLFFEAPSLITSCVIAQLRQLSAWFCCTCSELLILRPAAVVCFCVTMTVTLKPSINSSYCIWVRYSSNPVTVTVPYSTIPSQVWKTWWKLRMSTHDDPMQPTEVGETRNQLIGTSLDRNCSWPITDEIKSTSYTVFRFLTIPLYHCPFRSRVSPHSWYLWPGSLSK